MSEPETLNEKFYDSPANNGRHEDAKMLATEACYRMFFIRKSGVALKKSVILINLVFLKLLCIRFLNFTLMKILFLCKLDENLEIT